MINFADHSKEVLLLWVLFCYLSLYVCLCYGVLSVPCNIVNTCWERADLLAFLCAVFSCVFVPFTYDVPGQVRYLIVSIPDLCLISILRTVHL